MKFNHEDQPLVLRKLVQFLRSCREEGVPAERARDALLSIGIDRILVSEADRRIGDIETSNKQEDDDETALLLIPELAVLRAELVNEVRPAARFSVVQGGAALSPPPPPALPPGHSNHELPALTAQMLAEAPFLAAAEIKGVPVVDAPMSVSGLIQPPPLVSDVFARKLMRAGPAVVTTVLVAWAALHMPVKPSHIHIREALTAAPTTVGIQAPIASKTAAAIQNAPASAIARQDAQENETDESKPISRRAMYHHLKAGLQASLHSVATSEEPTERTPATDDTRAQPAGLGWQSPNHQVWWHEDEVMHEVAPDSVDPTR